MRASPALGNRVPSKMDPLSGWMVCPPSAVKATTWFQELSWVLRIRSCACPVTDKLCSSCALRRAAARAFSEVAATALRWGKTLIARCAAGAEVPCRESTFPMLLARARPPRPRRPAVAPPRSSKGMNHAYVTLRARRVCPIDAHKLRASRESPKNTPTSPMIEIIFTTRAGCHLGVTATRKSLSVPHIKYHK